MKKSVTLDDLRKWRMRRTMFLDGEGFYENHAVCNEEPRLTIVDSGPAGGKKNKHYPHHARKFYVDGIECPDADAVLTLLNAKPKESGE